MNPLDRTLATSCGDGVVGGRDSNAPAPGSERVSAGARRTTVNCSMPHDERFHPRERLRLKRDFARVFGGKCKAADAVLVVYAARNDLTWSRIGISVGKRIGNAVRRHYVKRRVREAFRRSKADLPRGLDIVCVARPPAADADVDVSASLRKLILKVACRCPTSDPDRTTQSDPKTAPKPSG
jgi:ribonuclease P protein component